MKFQKKPIKEKDIKYIERNVQLDGVQQSF